MFDQAPWLYPGAQQLRYHQLTMPPPIARPLFLEQDECRVQGSLQVGEAPQLVYIHVLKILDLKKTWD